MKILEFFLVLVAVAIFSAFGYRAKAEVETGPKTVQTPKPAKVQLEPQVSSSPPITELQVEKSSSQEKLVKPQSADDFDFAVKIDGKNVEFILTNTGDVTHEYFGSLRMATTGIPRSTWIQVLREDGTLYEEWRVSGVDWSPNMVTNKLSDIAIRLPASPEKLGAGEKLKLTIPLEKYFERSEFDSSMKGYQVRVLCELYLDENLNHYLEARSDWVLLEL